MLQTCQFKTRRKGDKSNIENSTDHFCEDTRQNALAALTNLGHVTPFLLLGPLIIYRPYKLHHVLNWQIFNIDKCIKSNQINQSINQSINWLIDWLINWLIEK